MADPPRCCSGFMLPLSYRWAGGGWVNPVAGFQCQVCHTVRDAPPADKETNR